MTFSVSCYLFWELFPNIPFLEFSNFFSLSSQLLLNSDKNSSAKPLLCPTSFNHMKPTNHNKIYLIIYIYAFVYLYGSNRLFYGVLKCGCNRISLFHKMSSRLNIIKDRDVWTWRPCAKPSFYIEIPPTTSLEKSHPIKKKTRKHRMRK